MPELRKDVLVNRWVVFAPERKQRPQDYQQNEVPLPAIDAFADGQEHYTPQEVYAVRPPHTKPDSPGWKVRVVPNRYPALRIEGNLDPEAVGFYDKMNGIGAHEVIIETPKPEMALEDQSLEDVGEVLSAYRTRMLDLMRDSRFRYILVFKNVGPLAGASIAHAHSQLIAMPVTPRTVKDKLRTAQEYFENKDRNIFEDILRNEVKAGERLVYENNGFVVFCPYASRFPFEMSIFPKRQSPDYHSIDAHETVLLADALRTALGKLGRGLDKPNYNLIVHTAPIRRPRKNYWSSIDFDFRWHIEILPRLVGVAGFEFGTGFYINTTLPEEAAQFLRQVKLKAS
jgi:UDPglucose--hexose-1-phosphate uridylyltransferase